MKHLIHVFLFSVFILPLAVWNFRAVESDEEMNDKFEPSEWFQFQRAYPYNDIPHQKYMAAVKAKEQLIAKAQAKDIPVWEPAGPTNIGGRITALEVDPNNSSVVYAAGAVGGVFKTTNNGDSWMPLTDFYPSLSVGALAMDKTNSKVLYCGTGEANISTDSYAGFGMLKTTDGGVSWFKSGLDSVRHIAEIKIHPLNNRSIFVAASGGLYSKSPHRGIYRSLDAGATWYKVLYLNDSTSAVDVALDPVDTSRIYAAVWDRLRGPTFRKAVGINSGLYLSTDGGWTWTRLSGGLPAPDPLIGRISIAVAPSNPNYVYALYKSALNGNTSTNGFYGFYRSTNKGQSWTRMPDGPFPSEFSNFGWYFGLLKVDPLNHLKVYLGEVDMFVTLDGGTSWTNITNAYSGTFEEQHPDMHALWINPVNTSVLYNGNDGGYYVSTNAGLNWVKKHELPLSQFYAATIDYLNPERLYGGTQDNGSIGTKTGQLNDWELLLGGDGFVSQVDYTNSNILYAEYQNCGISRSTDGGQSYYTIKSGLDLARTNWCTPYIIDPKNPSVLYLGTYRLHKTTNRGDLWTPVSSDLTRGLNGRLGTITAIAAAVGQDTSQRVLYVATDDAKVSVSTNSGSSWTDITGTLPRRYMTDVVVDKRNTAIAYITLSGYNLDEIMPHIFRTTNYGQDWTRISGQMPDVPVNSLIIDYNHDSVLYAGTDVGVFYTLNLGRSWSVLGAGLPNSPVFDLVYHQASKQLVAATHGRSMYRLDISSILTGVASAVNRPEQFELLPAYPNPFNPSTTVEFTIPQPGKVKIDLYSLDGRKVKELSEGNLSSGKHKILIDGNALSSGVYFISFGYKGFQRTQKIVLMK